MVYEYGGGFAGNFLGALGQQQKLGAAQASGGDAQWEQLYRMARLQGELDERDFQRGLIERQQQAEAAAAEKDLNQKLGQALGQWQFANNVEGADPQLAQFARTNPQDAMEIWKGRLTDSGKPITPYQERDLAARDERLSLDQDKFGLDREKFAAQQEVAGKPAPQLISGLRKEFTGVSSTFKDVRDSYKRIAASEESAAGDMALIFGLMKMFDPGSVVRETEFATAQNAAGVPARIRNWYNHVLSGERLSPEQRSEFRGQAAALYGEAYETFDAERGAYTNIAKRANIDPVDIISGIEAPTPESFQPKRKIGDVSTEELQQMLGGGGGVL